MAGFRFMAMSPDFILSPATSTGAGTGGAVAPPTKLLGEQPQFFL